MTFICIFAYAVTGTTTTVIVIFLWHSIRMVQQDQELRNFHLIRIVPPSPQPPPSVYLRNIIIICPWLCLLETFKSKETRASSQTNRCYLQLMFLVYFANADNLQLLGVCQGEYLRPITLNISFRKSILFLFCFLLYFGDFILFIYLCHILLHGT